MVKRDAQKTFGSTWGVAQFLRAALDGYELGFALSERDEEVLAEVRRCVAAGEWIGTGSTIYLVALVGRAAQALRLLKLAPAEPQPDAPTDIAALPDYWDERRKKQGKPDLSRCAAELRVALAQRADSGAEVSEEEVLRACREFYLAVLPLESYEGHKDMRRALQDFVARRAGGRVELTNGECQAIAVAMADMHNREERKDSVVTLYKLLERTRVVAAPEAEQQAAAEWTERDYDTADNAYDNWVRQNAREYTEESFCWSEGMRAALRAVAYRLTAPAAIEPGKVLVDALTWAQSTWLRENEPYPQTILAKFPAAVAMHETVDELVQHIRDHGMGHDESWAKLDELAARAREVR
ncbi:MAG TPA: hypothetical protein VFX59_21645 [Polyangiales bacterium]|nr:hypothetical protein [Polyangiales bacterium]